MSRPLHTPSSSKSSLRKTAMHPIQRTRTSFTSLSFVVILALVGCGDKASPPAASGGGAPPTPAAAVKAIEATAAVAAPSATPGVVAPLASNERLQGTIELDLGKGPVALRSVATTMDANLGKQVAERLNSAQGQQQVAKANDRIETITGAAGGKADTASQVQAIADSYAGKTVFTSTMRHVAIVKRHSVTLDAQLPKGPRITLDLQLSDKDNQLESARVSYYPNVGDAFSSFTTQKSGPDAAVVTLDKFERINDTTYAVEGSFKATNLVPAALAKKLQGQTVEQVQGRFKFTEVAVKPGL